MATHEVDEDGLAEQVDEFRGQNDQEQLQSELHAGRYAEGEGEMVRVGGGRSRALVSELSLAAGVLKMVHVLRPLELSKRSISREIRYTKEVCATHHTVSEGSMRVAYRLMIGGVWRGNGSQVDHLNRSTAVGRP